MKKIILLFSIIVMVCCSCTQSIRYTMTDVKPVMENALKSVTLSIYITEDQRRDKSPYKKWIFSESSKNRSNCINIEKKYGKLLVADEIEKRVVEHLNMKNCFKSVLRNQPDVSDFVVIFKLKSFVGKTVINQKAQTAEVAGAQFGFIGSLITSAWTSGMHSRLIYNINYAEVTIHDNKRDVTLPELCVLSAGSVKIPAVTHCNDVFYHLNKKLKNHNDKFADVISNKIIAQITGKEFEVEEEY
jgi:hypothetical protein